MISRNSKCPCGSELRYKNCCGRLDRPGSLNRISQGGLPATVHIESDGEGEAGVIVSGMEMTVGDVTHTLLEEDEKVTVSTNNVKGDKFLKSSATISIPFEKELDGVISIKGNASVSKGKEKHSIAITDGKAKLKAKNDKGLFCVVRVRHQQNEGLHFFDVLFGVQGEKEELSDQGIKNRPHLAFYPDGSGKFIRLSGNDCVLSTSLTFKKESNSIYPSYVEVKTKSLDASILLFFGFDDIRESVILESVKFET